MIDPEIDKISKEDEIRFLKKKICKLEKVFKWGAAIVTFVTIIAGIFGFNAWSFISGKIDELNKSAEKVEERYDKLNKQIFSTVQNNITLNTQLSGLSTEITRKYNELLQQFTKLKQLSANAKDKSEEAMYNAGKLIDAVEAAQTAAKKSSVASNHMNMQLRKIEDYVKSIRMSFAAIQKTQKNLDAYIANNVPLKPSVKPFTVSVSSHYGEYIVCEGDGVPYDKVLAGYRVTGYIIIPKNYSAIIDDSGYENTFWISNKVKTRVDMRGDGKYRHVRSGERYFK